LPPAPRHQLAETASSKHPSVAPAILKKFEGDVQKMEQPVMKLEGRLEQTLARMHARRAHRQALHLYNTDTESWRELSRKAEHERAKRVADAASESRDLINDMSRAMEDADHKMKSEMRETNDSMKRELQDVVQKFQAEGRGKVSKAEHEAIAETEARQREMGEVMSEYVHHERDVNDKLRSEMRDLVESSAHQKADMVSEAEHWKMAEEAKYKHEMEAQVKQAEMKVDQARSEAAMALHAAQHDTSAGSRERLHAAEEHEQHALRALSKAELEERQQARVYQREASEEHARVKALEDQLEHFEAQHQLRKEVLAERRRERERMEDRFETRQRQEERKDAMLEEQVKDARSVAEKEREAALARAKQLAVERVKRQALRAEAHERARLQAAEDLAEQRKAEAHKEKRLAAKEAAELRLERQYRTQRRRQLTGPTPPAAAAERVGKVSRGRARGGVDAGKGKVGDFKAAMQAEVKKELASYEAKIAAQEKLAVKQAAARARKAQHSKVDLLSEKLQRVENRLWRKEQSKKLAVENVFGSLGAYSKRRVATQVGADGMLRRPPQLTLRNRGGLLMRQWVGSRTPWRWPRRWGLRACRRSRRTSALLRGE